MIQTDRFNRSSSISLAGYSLTKFDYILVAISLSHVAFTLLSFYVFGDRMTYDAAKVWKPFADQVLAGATPYIDVWDNKPPLWQYLNLTVAATGAYALVFYILLGIANGVSALLVKRVCRQRRLAQIGALAALLYVTVIPLLNGMNINPRQFAAIALLVGFITSRPIVSGLAVATAGLLSQFSILVIPAVLIDRYYSGDLTLRWLMRFCGAGLALAILAYLSIALLWGTDALVAAVQTTVRSSGEYVATRRFVLWENTLDWAKLMYGRLLTIAPLVVLAATGTLLATLKKLNPQAEPLAVTCIIACVGLALPLTFRPGPIYIFAMLPFLTVLSAIGAASFLTTA